MTSVVIPGLCAVIFIKTMFQMWYYHPYENIFETLMPLNFCTGTLMLLGGIILTQMFGARAGNIESSISVNIYMVLQTMLVILLMTQWSFMINQYQ